MSTQNEGLNRDDLTKLAAKIDAEYSAEFKAIDQIVDDSFNTGELEYTNGEYVSIEQALKDIEPAGVQADMSEIQNQGYYICKSAVHHLQAYMAAHEYTHAIKMLGFSLERSRMHPDDKTGVFEPYDEAGLVAMKPVISFSDYLAAFVVVDKAQAKVIIAALIPKTETSAIRNYFNSLL